MKRWLKLFALLCCTGAAQAQSFDPDAAAGTYHGPLEQWKNNQWQRLLDMELQIGRISDTSWTWTIRYLGDTTDERKYLLYRSADGRYRIDEQNSIVLSLNTVGYALHSCFEVEGTLLFVSYLFEKKADQVTVDFYFYNTARSLDTGGTGTGIPAVKDHAFGGSQRAKLSRK